MGIPLLFVAFPFLLLMFCLFAEFFLVWLVYVLACFSFGLPCVGLSVLVDLGVFPSTIWGNVQPLFLQVRVYLSLSSPWTPIMWMLVCLISSTKCLKLSSIFWLIFFFLVLRSGDFHYSVFLFLLLNINVFIFIGGWLLYSAVVVLPHIDMNPPRVHMCSPSWGPAPPSGSAGAPAGTAVCVSLLICPLNHPICWLICCIFHVSYCILPL